MSTISPGSKIIRLALTVLLALVFLLVSFSLVIPNKKQSVIAADDCQLFPETNFQVCGRFLTYWRENGGLTQQGFPISNAFNERNQPQPAGDGQVHMVQYFQRARFELHPENPPPYDVLLGLVGSEQYAAKFGNLVVEPTPKLVIRNKSNYTSVDETHVPKSGNTFLVLDILLTNSTGMVLNLDPANFRVKTSANYEYYAAAASYILDNSLKAGNLKSGETTGGVLVFELPQMESPVSITLTYGQDKVTTKIS